MMLPRKLQPHVNSRPHVRGLLIRSTAVQAPAASITKTSQLAQLAKMTVLSIDTGDLSILRKWASTGLITDATTNPLFVSQAAARGNEPEYAALLDAAVSAAKTESGGGKPNADAINLAIDHLSVNLGKKILEIVSGYVSTEVDIRLSYDAKASEIRARRIISLYETAGIPRDRVLIKLAGTWEGIKCAEVLENEGIRTNITLVFGVMQAVAAAQAGCTLISPFPGRVLEWIKADQPNGPQSFSPAEDPGVIATRRMFNYFRHYQHNTICMPASWRSSTGSEPLDEIRALSGTDRMTIPPPLLEALAASEAPLPRELSTEKGMQSVDPEFKGDRLTEEAFRWKLTMDGAANDKMAAGIRAFAGDTARLVSVIEAHPGWTK
jgi:transaldolase